MTTQDGIRASASERATREGRGTPALPGATADGARPGRARASRRVPISTFACKVAMAVTGLVFALYVLAHMLGNLKVYQGASHFDAYARWLRTIAEPLVPHGGVLWVVRVVLVASLVAHVACAIVVASRARRARGAFPRTNLARATFASRSMLATGLALLAFLGFHLLDLTLGVRPAAASTFEAGAAYANLVASLARPGASLVYAGVTVLLALHTSHGIWTAAHDLGATGARLRSVARGLGLLVAFALLLGNLSIPIAVLLGRVR